MGGSHRELHTLGDVLTLARKLCHLLPLSEPAENRALSRHGPNPGKGGTRKICAPWFKNTVWYIHPICPIPSYFNIALKPEILVSGKSLQKKPMYNANSTGHAVLKTA
ncbi:BTB/POZ domain-containing adapter for CUL3-mediated RhoA degradation protein 1 [Platysternon megacephalum]|uniref:BTB/POZ domain-containing adapter for CUL3-mediated RhoA degradation protein 1 n=1 Tax=Platysternon megacephalum TaxID=55544 RepID=A0A4D9DLD4_9SAUR|nr:BTB/POZ domain-containing adapter for CUL3-mediated RhoA degradation protein 1 [Platysternon megacephalum]